jgi:hypothetical protein
VAEHLATAEGEPVDLGAVDAEFARAMAAPAAGDPEAPPPPEIGADPEAPFGRKVDGTPKRGRGGRPPTRERARTEPGPAALSGPQKPGKGGGQQPEAGRDYSAGLSDLTEVIWLALAGLPIPGEAARIRCRVQAAVIKDNQAGLVGGVNILAQHNAAVRWGVEHLAAGGGAWIFPAALALMPFAVQTSMLWRAPVNGDMQRMAEAVEADFGKVFGKILADMGLADIVDESPGAAEDAEAA